MPTDIRPGDILLHMGTAEISKLIAWAGNSDYSHAAVVLGPDTLVEATGQGVGTASLQDRLRQTAAFSWIDAYRFVPDLTPAGLDGICTVAYSYIGTPYALNELAQLGLLCAFRNKVPRGPWGRWLVRQALDLALKSSTKGLTCSEFAYRCFAQAGTPPHALRPQIVIQPRSDPPFPDIDWTALWREYRQAAGHAPRGLEAAEAWPPSAEEPVSDEDLESLAAAVRERHGAQADLLAASGPGVPGDLGPNPKSVEPGDLAASRSFARRQRVLP